MIYYRYSILSYKCLKMELNKKCDVIGVDMIIDPLLCANLSLYVV